MHNRYFFISYTFKLQNLGWGSGSDIGSRFHTKRPPFTSLTPVILDYIINEITKTVPGIEGRVILTLIQEIEQD